MNAGTDGSSWWAGEACARPRPPPPPHLTPPHPTHHPPSASALLLVPSRRPPPAGQPLQPRAAAVGHHVPQRLSLPWVLPLSPPCPQLISCVTPQNGFNISQGCSGGLTGACAARGGGGSGRSQPDHLCTSHNSIRIPLPLQSPPSSLADEPFRYISSVFATTEAAYPYVDNDVGKQAQGGHMSGLAQLGQYR